MGKASSGLQTHRALLKEQSTGIRKVSSWQIASASIILLHAELQDLFFTTHAIINSNSTYANCKKKQHHFCTQALIFSLTRLKIKTYLSFMSTSYYSTYYMWGFTTTIDVFFIVLAKPILAQRRQASRQ